MEEKQIIKLHEKVLYPTVRVRTDKAGGSGTVIYSEKVPEKEIYETYILTNYHVIADAIKIEKKWNAMLGRELKTDMKSDVTVEFFNFEYFSWEEGHSATKAEIIDYHEDMDIALLRLKSTRKRKYVAELFPKGREKEELRMFMPVFAVGCGLGHPPLATQGHLTGFNDIIDNYPYWLQTAPTIFGNSGGSVYLADNYQYIGIPSRIAVTMAGFSADAITHLSFFIPILSIYKFLDDNLLYFLYDKSYTSEECWKLREQRKKQDERELLLEGARGE